MKYMSGLLGWQIIINSTAYQLTIKDNQSLGVLLLELHCYFSSYITAFS